MLPLLQAAPPFFLQVTVLLIAGAGVAYLCFRFGLVPIIGFLLAGALIGPNALALVTDRALIDAAAEVGVILLLFTIGIEFSLGKLAAIQRVVFVGGGVQVALAAGVTTGLLMLLGVGFGPALFTGFLVAVSSTAISLKLLSGRGQVDAPVGQVSLGVSLFQDLATIAMVLLVPTLAGGAGGGALDVLRALGVAAVLIVVVLVVARRVMPPVLEAVARTCSPELFLLTVVAICFGTALLSSLAGVSLSLGAFLAGLIVSESRYSEHAMGEILPLQILFSATFFVSVGMLLDVGFVIANVGLVLGAVAVVLVVKAATTFAAVRVLGYPAGVAGASAMVLAQVGEFSFVLERAGREAGLAPAGLAEGGSETFIAATVLLMVATPGLYALGERWRARMDRRTQAAADARAQRAPLEPLPALARHVVLSGYGDGARKLARVLKASGIPFVITTLSPDGATEAQADGMLVVLGDGSRQSLLEHVGIARAKLLVVADDAPAQAARVATVARLLNPTIRIVARTRSSADLDALLAAGADRVVPEDLESVVALLHETFETYAVDPDQAAAHETAARADAYAVLRRRPGDLVLRGNAPTPDPCALSPDCLDTRSVTVRPGAPIIGETVGRLEALEIEVRALERGGDVDENPPDARVVQAGDRLTLTAREPAYQSAAGLFRVGSAPDHVAGEEGPRWVDTHAAVTLDLGGEACGGQGGLLSVTPRTDGCEECLEGGTRWVHLRVCMTCGHVGCCDSSPGKHASAHYHETGHAAMRSVEPGEAWGWCFEGERLIGG
jgi:CPA2 family monovalent cation:H+ antiporter-2